MTLRQVLNMMKHSNVPAVSGQKSSDYGFSFRRKTAMILGICCIASAMLSLILGYVLGRSNVSQEYEQAEISAVASLEELHQRTRLPVETLTVMVGNDEVLLAVTDTESANLTPEQMQELLTSGKVTVTAGYNALPVTYAVVDGTFVSIRPVNGLNIFSVLTMRLSTTSFSFFLIFIFACTLAAQLIARPVQQMTRATRQVQKGDFSVRLPDE